MKKELRYLSHEDILSMNVSFETVIEVVEKVLSSDCPNMLIHVTPVGGWRNVLDLHFDLLTAVT